MQCLVLNASYEPMRMFDMPRAVRLVFQGKAEVVESTGKVLRSGSREIPQPAVIRLVKMVNVPRKFRRQVSNTFLFARDAYTCQYCGRTDKELRQREALNRDHIMPKSRGGENTWENCVTSCSTCNSKKENRTPQEAGMKLRSEPVEPHLVHLKWKVRKVTAMQEKYLKMFFGEDWRAQVK
jgi:5-methylcytosine-specific restriction endonuclease McrA